MNSVNNISSSTVECINISMVVSDNDCASAILKGYIARSPLSMRHLKGLHPFRTGELHQRNTLRDVVEDNGIIFGV